MRKPNRQEFYDETTDTYNGEDYEEALGDYADAQRDEQIERQWEEENNNDTD